MPLDLNELLEDVSRTVQTEGPDAATVSTDFRTLPTLTLRPQRIGSALSHLLQYAVEQARPDGSVRISTRTADSRVEIAIESSATQGSTEAANVFDPTLEMQGRRVAAGNWELFTSRQLIREHDGEIQTEQLTGGGLRFLVVLPAQTV